MMTFDAAFREFYQAIVGYCLSKLSDEDTCAEDLASECFILLSVKWNELQSHEPIVIRVWLFRVARNKIMDYKKKKRLQTVSFDEEVGREQLELELYRLSGNFSELEEIQRYQMYLIELQKILTVDEWRLFDLVVNQKLTFRGIAEQLKTTEAAAKMRWMRLRARLKQLLPELFRKKERYN